MTKSLKIKLGRHCIPSHAGRRDSSQHMVESGSIVAQLAGKQLRTGERYFSKSQKAVPFGLNIYERLDTS